MCGPLPKGDERVDAGLIAADDTGQVQGQLCRTEGALTSTMLDQLAAAGVIEMAHQDDATGHLNPSSQLNRLARRVRVACMS
jgi:hypothetical protein